MKKNSILILWTLVILLVGCGPREQGGTYTFGDPQGEEACGSLKVHPISNDRAVFFLEVNSGQPYYRAYELQGTMEINGNNGSYNGKVDAAAVTCELSFRFSDDGVEIIPHLGRKNCNLGMPFSLARVFALSDRTIPEHYVTLMGDTVLFEQIQIER